jgi:hypothetical protein
MSFIVISYSCIPPVFVSSSKKKLRIHSGKLGINGCQLDLSLGTLLTARAEYSVKKRELFFQFKLLQASNKRTSFMNKTGIQSSHVDTQQAEQSQTIFYFLRQNLSLWLLCFSFYYPFMEKRCKNTSLRSRTYYYYR